MGDYETETPEGNFLCRTYFAKIVEGEPIISELEKENLNKFNYFSYDNLLYLNEEGVLAPNLRLALPKLKEYIE